MCVKRYSILPKGSDRTITGCLSIARCKVQMNGSAVFDEVVEGERGGGGEREREGEKGNVVGE